MDKTLLSESDLRKWAYDIQKEILKEGGEAEEKLKAKCRWEKMSRIKVVLEFGDPREWLG